MPTAISQLTVGDMPKGKDGRIYGDHPNLVERNVPTGDGQAAQVTTLTATAANDTRYAYSVEGTVIEYTSDAAATLTEIADGLTAAHQASVVANTIMTAVSGGVAGTVTLTARHKGEDVEIVVLDGPLADALTTEASDGAVLPFGRVVVKSSEGKARLPEAGDTAADLYGFARYTDDEASRTIGDSGDVGYPPGRDALIIRNGPVYVAGSQANQATDASAVWVGTDAGEAGKLFTADNAGTTRIEATSGFAWREANVLEVFTSNL